MSEASVAAPGRQAVAKEPEPVLSCISRDLRDLAQRLRLHVHLRYSNEQECKGKQNAATEVISACEELQYNNLAMPPKGPLHDCQDRISWVVRDRCNAF